MNKKESSKSPLHSFQKGDMLTLECVEDVEQNVSHLREPPPLTAGGKTHTVLDWVSRALSDTDKQKEGGKKKKRVTKLNFLDVP